MDQKTTQKNAPKKTVEKPWYGSYLKGVPHSIAYKKITLPEAFHATVKEFPNHHALTYMGKVITFKELGNLVDRFAAALAAMGVKKGSRVATLLPNVPQMVIAYYGAMTAGAALVLNNPLYTDRELEHQLNDSESEYLVTLDLLAPG